MRTIANYFLYGLIFIFPLFATFYVVVFLVNWVDDTLYSILFGWVPFDLPGLGIVTAFFIIIITGFFVTRAFTTPIFNYFERLVERTPFVKIIYTSFKDLTESLLGDKKRFNRPARVKLTDGVDRIGFITEDNLSTFGIDDRVAVYFPHSYNFSGNLFLIDPEFVTPLNIDPADALKFAISAGVTHVSKVKKKTES
ncbi:DUF502 domain-containing protein [Rhodohalobacter sp. 8-1]|uniref:DUF502 domain-containing protein n=1 Tax=Rhodohalobacter sp. 8-1 TaxID=3131972 RepID=UPI0030EB9BC0